MAAAEPLLFTEGKTNTCMDWRRRTHHRRPQLFFNPFTAPARKISGLKDARTRKWQSVFRSVNISTFHAKRFDEVLSQARAKTKTERLKGVKFRTFISRFQMRSRHWKG